MGKTPTQIIGRLVITLGLVGTGMGDRSPVWVAFAPSRYLINHPGQLSLAIPSWVREVSTSDGYGHCWGRKPASSVYRSCFQDGWHTDHPVAMRSYLFIYLKWISYKSPSISIYSYKNFQLTNRNKSTWNKNEKMTKDTVKVTVTVNKSLWTAFW